MKTQINKSDENYRDAVNYDGTQYYNFPMSIDVDGVKYIIPCGTSDSITIKEINENTLVVIGENNRLDYVGMTEINTSEQTTQSCFLHDNDITDPENPSYDILEEDTDSKIRILYEYMI